LGEGEGGDGALRAARQELALLLLGSEKQDRLRYADALMRREQRGDVAVHAAEELHHLAVFALVESEPAVLFRDLHPESAHLAQALDHRRRVLPAAVDRGRVELFAQEALHLPVEGAEPLPLLQRLRKGMDELEAKVAEEEIAEKTVALPLLSRRLGHFQGSGRVHCHAMKLATEARAGILSRRPSAWSASEGRTRCSERQPGNTAGESASLCRGPAPVACCMG